MATPDAPPPGKSRRRWVGVLATMMAGAIAAAGAIVVSSGGRAAPEKPPAVTWRPTPPTAAGDATSATASGPPTCRSSQLVASAAIAASSQVAPGLSWAALKVTNQGTTPCLLATLPAMALVDGAGALMGMEPPGQTIDVTIAPGPAGAKMASLSWQNWCGADPRPVQLRIVVPDDGGVVTAPYGDAATTLPNCFNSRYGPQVSVTAPLSSVSLFGDGGR